MPTFYGLPSDGTVIPEQLETALAADIAAPESPIGGAIRAAFPEQAANVYEAFDGYKLASGPGVSGAGDSLTQGAGGNGTSWPSVLSGILTSAYTIPGTVTNLGVGGESSATIAGRVGLGVPWVATVAGGTIPSSGGVTVTLASSDGASVAPLLQGSAGVNPVQIAGVTGTLTHSGGVYTFTRTTAGDTVAVDGAAPVSTQAQRDRQGDIFVMWWGQNDGQSDATAIIRRQQATISRFRAFQKRWIVLGLSSGSESSRAAMDAQFQAAHGDRFLNIRKVLSSADALSKEGITPTAADNTAIAAGSVPPSFLFDSVHLNAAGYRRVGRAIYEKIKALGWNDQWGVLGDDEDVRVPTTYFADDFERTSANVLSTPTPVGAKTWSAYSAGAATAPIVSGAMSVSLNGDSEAYVWVDGGSTDGVFNAKLRTPGATRSFLIARMTDLNNFLRLGSSGTGQWVLVQKAGGTSSDLATNLGPVTAGDDVKIAVNGTNCTVTLNGSQVWSGAISAALTGTKFGTLAWPDSSGMLWESMSFTEVL